MAASTTAASLVLREAIKYEAHPHRSLRICLKYMIDIPRALNVPASRRGVF